MNRSFIHDRLADAIPNQQVALVRVTEECAELAKEAGKALRFGPENRYPAEGPTNVEKMRSEFDDVRAALVDAGVLPDRPRVVVLSGSTKFIDTMAVEAWKLEKTGAIALGCHLLPRSYTDVQHHLAEAEGVAEILDEVHRRKIDLAGEMLVINVGGYIGDRTRSEIEYAERHGKPVRYLEPCADETIPADFDIAE